MIGADAVLGAVSAADAIACTEGAFKHHARGEWTMPPKAYLQSPPGDFRSMPARGDGFALLKWVTSFPDNPRRGLPVVTGVVILSDAKTGENLAVMDCRPITWLRTGAAAAVSAKALAARDASSVGLIGSGVSGAWAARCIVAAGFDGLGICHDADAEVSDRLSEELGWTSGSREQAVAQDIVITCTPGTEPVVFATDLRPGQHFAVLGADSREKSEVERRAFRHCTLFCDEWNQASHGGELSRPVEALAVRREDVTELGAVLTGTASGRMTNQEITLFDSTGLAIQDLGVAGAVYAAWKDGRVEAIEVPL